MDLTTGIAAVICIILFFPMMKWIKIFYEYGKVSHEMKETGKEISKLEAQLAAGNERHMNWLLNELKTAEGDHKEWVIDQIERAQEHQAKMAKRRTT